MGSIIWLFVLWTWGLAPLWVNVTASVLLGAKIIYYIGYGVVKGLSKFADDKGD